MQMKVLTLFLVLFHRIVFVLCYEVPPALVEPLHPRGLRVSIPDHEGITLFAFHGNINIDFEMGHEAGQMAQDVLRKRNGRWTFINRSVSLKKGDVIYYWLYVIHNGLGKERLFQQYTVTEFFTEGTSPTLPKPDEPTREIIKPECKSSMTLVNDVPQCSGNLILDVKFTDKLDKKLTHVVQISDSNEEFVVYDSQTDNSFLENGKLVIKPTLLDDKYGDKFSTNGLLDLTSRCTSTDSSLCRNQAIGKQFLPPVLSARLTTKDSFSFRYGVVEVRAKLPRGDWVVPELWLLPKLKKYGQSNSGKIIIASAFGNKKLISSNKEIGNRHLLSGLQVGEQRLEFTNDKANGFWSDDFHTFKVLWNPELISFHVDNIEIGQWNSNTNTQFLGNKNAPFNEEFYLVLGLQVGGTIFPDGSISDGHVKPWNNTNADIIKRFYFDLPKWYQTWNENTQLKIEYVKVWAL